MAWAGVPGTDSGSTAALSRNVDLVLIPMEHYSQFRIVQNGKPIFIPNNCTAGVSQLCNKEPHSCSDSLNQSDIPVTHTAWRSLFGLHWGMWWNTDRALSRVAQNEWTAVCHTVTRHVSVPSNPVPFGCFSVVFVKICRGKVAFFPSYSKQMLPCGAPFLWPC